MTEIDRETTDAIKQFNVLVTEAEILTILEGFNYSVFIQLDGFSNNADTTETRLFYLEQMIKVIEKYQQIEELNASIKLRIEQLKSTLKIITRQVSNELPSQ